MPLLFGVGRQDCWVPVVFSDLNAGATGRPAVPNGTGYTYPAKFSVGWQTVQQGNFTTPPLQTSAYYAFQADGNVNVFTQFQAFGDTGLQFGVNGGWYLDASKNATLSLCPFRLNVPTTVVSGGTPYHTFISCGGSTGRPCPSNWSNVFGTVVGRYSFVLYLGYPKVPGPGNQWEAYSSDWFDVAPALALTTGIQAFPVSATAMKLVWDKVGIGTFLEKSYDNGTTWRPVIVTNPGGLTEINAGYYDPALGIRGYYLTSSYYVDTNAYQLGRWPIYRVSTVGAVTGVNYLSNVTAVSADYRYASEAYRLRRPKMARNL